MKSIINKIAASIVIVMAMVVAPLAMPTLVTAAPKDEVCKGIAGAGGGNACNNPDRRNDLSNFIKRIVNILLFVIGTIAVIMIIIGGIKYVTSNGDSNGVTSAKNTILYSVVGLVVALMAYAIVNFVVGAL